MRYADVQSVTRSMAPLGLDYLGPMIRTNGLPWRVTWNTSPAAARSMYQPKRSRNLLAPTTVGCGFEVELAGLEPATS